MFFGGIMDLAQLARQILSGYDLKGANVLLGLSGGADSVFLFYVLCEIRRLGGPDLSAVHINHMLRGEAADGDEEFVRALCEAEGVKLYVRREDVCELAGRLHTGTEAAGRMVRYEEFFAHAVTDRSNILFLAHHANDNEETILMNFLRGAGAEGLAGIKYSSVIEREGKQITVLRPLLGLTHAQICGELTRMGRTWREDATNAENDCTRNVLRNDIIPRIRELYPSFTATCEREAAIFTDIADYLEGQAGTFLTEHGMCERGRAEVSVQALKQAHPALKGAVIRRMVCAAGGLTDISAVNTADVLKLTQAQSGREIVLPRGMRALRDFDRLVVKGCGPEARDGSSIRLTRAVYKGEAPDLRRDATVKCFDYDKVLEHCGAEPVVRRPMPGDYMITDAQGGTKQLAKYLKQEKISASMRGDIPVLAAGNCVLYVGGHRRCEGFFVDETTKTVLKAEYVRQ